MHRSFTASVVSAALAMTLAACTSNTQSCKGGVCEIDLHGAGASTDLGGEGGSVLELVSAGGNAAKVTLAGKPITLTVGQPIALGNGTLVLEEIEGEDDIQLRAVAGSQSSTPTTAAGTSPVGDAPSTTTAGP